MVLLQALLFARRPPGKFPGALPLQLVSTLIARAMRVSVSICLGSPVLPLRWEPNGAVGVPNEENLCRVQQHIGSLLEIIPAFVTYVAFGLREENDQRLAIGHSEKSPCNCQLAHRALQCCHFPREVPIMI